jgi:dTDP-4-dehydrorhamnose reductase
MRRDLRLLVVGGSGELGQQVLLAAAGTWEVHATFLRRPRPLADESWHQLDVIDFQAVHHLIRQLRPNAVIHTALSDRDRVHFSSDEVFHLAIQDGGRHVAEAASEAGARCIVMSTDLVFDGRRGNYTEDDPPHPIMGYGQAKANMERALLAMGTDLAIVRTSLILTLEPMGRHVAWIVDAPRRGEQRDLFTDELRCPIWSDQLATALLELAALEYRGLLHVAGLEVSHRYALGLALADYFGLDPSFITPALSAKSGLNRPLDCTLDCNRAYRLLKTPIHGVSARLPKFAPGRDSPSPGPRGAARAGWPGQG